MVSKIIKLSVDDEGADEMGTLMRQPEANVPG